MTETSAPRIVPVWDLPLRLFHWSLVLLFTLSWASGRMGKLDLHMKAGLVIMSLLFFRLAWGVMGSQTARFASFVGGPGRIRAYLRGQWSGLGHNPLGALSVLAMLGLLLAQTGTGLFATDDIATDGPLAWMVSSRTVKQLSALHRQGSWLLLGLVAAHLGAIVYYRVKAGENLVTPMISGVKRIDRPVEPPAQANPWLALILVALALAGVFGAVAAWGK